MRKALDRQVVKLRKMDPWEAITVAAQINQELLVAQGEVAAVRRTMVRQLRMDGWTLAAIGERLNLTPQRIRQMELDG